MITNGINSNVNVSGLPTTLEANSQLEEAGFKDSIFIPPTEEENNSEQQPKTQLSDLPKTTASAVVNSKIVAFLGKIADAIRGGLLAHDRGAAEVFKDEQPVIKY